MSRMHNNVWVFFVPIMITMKIEYTIPGKISSLEFALFVKFIVSHKRRRIIFVFIIFRRLITKHPVYSVVSSQNCRPKREKMASNGLEIFEIVRENQNSVSFHSRSLLFTRSQTKERFFCRFLEIE